MKNKILVIEDDRAISELLCMNLEAAGYETVPVQGTGAPDSYAGKAVQCYRTADTRRPHPQG